MIAKSRNIYRYYLPSEFVDKMNDSNTEDSNSSHYPGYTKIWELYNELQTNHSDALVIESLFFDLIPAILSSVFAFRFYEGIEISHPLYSIIFMDILVSTISSYLSFLLTIINGIANEHIVAHLKLAINSTSGYFNVSSFMMITFIRYYLLVYLKKQGKDTNEVDIIKVRNILLITNSVLFVCFLVIRVSLHTAVAIGYESEKAKLGMAISGTFLAHVQLLITLVLNYRIDNYLKKEHDVKDSEENASKVFSKRPVSYNSNAENRDKSHRNGRNNDVSKFELGRNLGYVNESTETKASISEIFQKNPFEDDTFKTHDAEHSKVEDYGGIYIGSPRIINSRATDNKIANHNSYDSCNMLPNQVSNEDKNTSQPIQINIELHQAMEEVDISPTNPTQIRSMSNHSRNRLNGNQRSGQHNENDIDVVEVIDDEVSDLTPSNVVFPTESEDNTVEISKLYKDSREYKSIVKSITVTYLSIFLILILPLLGIFIQTHGAFHFGQDVNLCIIVMCTIVWKLFRSFVVIATSIYCFDIIRSLFLTMMSDIYEFFQMLWNGV